MKILSNTNGEKDMPVFSNVKVNWASVQEPNKSVEYGDKWEVEVELTADQATTLNNEGFKTKKNDKGIDTIRVKRKTTGTKRAGGTFNKQQPKCVDSVKQPFTDLIGNGSVCNVAYNILEHGFGKSLDFAGIQVLELVSYGGGGSDAADEFESVGGTTMTNAVAEEDCPF